MATGTFDLLSPNVIVAGVESFLDAELDGTLTAYPSYVNRVYGVRDVDGTEYIVKYYRPGRWSDEAILQEHEFVLDCESFDVPVVAPISTEDEATLGSVVAEAEDDSSEQEFLLAVFPKRGGRNFDAESDGDWHRLGSIVARVHAAAVKQDAPDRLVCTPQTSTFGFLDELQSESVVHPEVAGEFFDLAGGALEWIAPLFDEVDLHRIHGDFHRGNILDRPGEGLLVVDFDDMMTGPAVHDLWLLLPDRAHAARRELELILDGYQEFMDFDRNTLALVEPLRLMRMIYYVAWSSRQRHDLRFRESFPQWGGKAFWEKELEDLRTQIAVINDEINSEETDDLT